MSLCIPRDVYIVYNLLSLCIPRDVYIVYNLLSLCIPRDVYIVYNLLSLCIPRGTVTCLHSLSFATTYSRANGILANARGYLPLDRSVWQFFFLLANLIFASDGTELGHGWTELGHLGHGWTELRIGKLVYEGTYHKLLGLF